MCQLAKSNAEKLLPATEMLGFVLLPMILYFYSFRKQNLTLIKVASLITMIGIVLNRLNITVIGFRWDAATHDKGMRNCSSTVAHTDETVAMT